MTKTLVELTPFEVGSICDYIDTANSAPNVIVNMLVDTWNTILRREGKTLSTIDSLDPTAYAIPELQWATINNAAMQRAKEIGTSDIGVTEVGLEFVNKGPASYDPAKES